MVSRLPSFWFGLIAVAVLAVFEIKPAHTESAASIQTARQQHLPLQLVQSAQGDIPMPADAPSAHASSLVALPNHPTSAVAAAWFAGERESAPDVRIAFSSFDRASQQWTPAKYVVDRELLGASLGFGIRRLGNPVLWRDANDRLHLFVVGTGPGGWAASRIIHLQQQGNSSQLDDIGFRPRQVLPLSWFWNISHLVRNSPLPLADGGAVLPVYFEVGAKYPVIATLSASGDFTGMTRISSRRNLLQPALVPIDEQHWLAYMRMSGGTQRIAAAETRDGGQHWRDLPDLPLPNPNAAVAALSVGNVHALAFNPSINSRSVLSLALSKDGLDWSTIADVEKGAPGDEFSYPSLAWADDALWVSYTNRREKISWKRYEFVREAQ